MPINQIMNSPVTSLHGETGYEISQKLKRFRVGSVVILAPDGNPIGLVTDGDLISKILVENKRPQSVIARELMSKPLRTLNQFDDVATAVRTMRKYGVKRLGVMDDKRLVGVVSMSDIASIAPDLITLLNEKLLITGEKGFMHIQLSSGSCDSCGRWSDDLREISGTFVCNECARD
jgi:CBS domain-containing protein